nr:MAG: major capsid protein [Microvirus sp.]
MLVNKYAKAKTGLDFARNVFNFKKGHKTNFLTGRIVPSIDPIEVLPGDSFNLSFAAVVRSAPLVAPILDDIFIDVLAFWVPHRLIMNEFAQFLGENNTKAWTLKQDVDLPTIKSVQYPLGASLGYYADHYLAPHFGFRNTTKAVMQFDNPAKDFFKGVVVLKSRGYVLIYNEWWRDENIIDPVLFTKTSTPNHTLDFSLFGTGLGIQRKACRLSDFWNKMLPAPQRGDSVGIDLLGFAPVITRDTNVTYPYHADSDSGWSQTLLDKIGLKWYEVDGSVGDDPSLVTGSGQTLGFGAASAGPSLTGAFGTQGSSADFINLPANLWADLSNVSALTINQLRYAIMLQRFYEISARGGMREVEFYQAQFGVTSSDARFMRSELLTQKRYRINISQVINQAGSSDGTSETAINSALGSTGAYSVTGIKGHLFSKTFTEYGYIHIQHVIRTQPSISTGYDRTNFKKKFFDHFLPVFDHIGEQAYYNIELGEVSQANIDVFGYNEAWAEYRYQYSDAVGLFTPGEPLEYWTLARKLTSPVLNQKFIEQGIEEFDRALIFPMIGTGTGRDDEGVLLNSNTYQWLIDFYVTGKMARTMSKDSTPGILGRI